MIRIQLTLGTGVRFPSPPPLWGCTWISTGGTMVARRLPVVDAANNGIKSKRQYFKLRHGRLIGAAGVYGEPVNRIPYYDPKSHNDPSGHRKVSRTTDVIQLCGTT